MEVHQKYSSSLAIKEEDGYHFSKDYDKFWYLNQHKQKYLISTIPGWSTHCDNNHLSPTVNWETVINCDRLNNEYVNQNSKKNLTYN